MEAEDLSNFEFGKAHLQLQGKQGEQPTTACTMVRLQVCKVAWRYTGSRAFL